MSTQFNIPSHLQGLIIGKGGANIKDIQTKNSVKVEFGTAANGILPVTISGTGNAAAAKAAIDQIVQANRGMVDTKTAQHVLSVPLPVALRKYALGNNGENLKTIQSSTFTKVDFPNDNEAKVFSHEAGQVEKAKELLVASLAKFDWFWDEAKKTYVEKSSKEAVFRAARAKAEAFAQERETCYSQAKKEFDSGDKAKAKQLSEQGKLADENMKKANKDAAMTIFKYNNQNNDQFTIDLHNLYVQEALDILDEKMKAVAGQKGKKFTVIFGAGNHSKDAALIKPKVLEVLKKSGKKYTDVNVGSVEVDL